MVLSQGIVLHKEFPALGNPLSSSGAAALCSSLCGATGSSHLWFWVLSQGVERFGQDLGWGWSSGWFCACSWADVHGGATFLGIRWFHSPGSPISQLLYVTK